MIKRLFRFLPAILPALSALACLVFAVGSLTVNEYAMAGVFVFLSILSGAGAVALVISALFVKTIPLPNEDDLPDLPFPLICPVCRERRIEAGSRFTGTIRPARWVIYGVTGLISLTALIITIGGVMIHEWGVAGMFAVIAILSFPPLWEIIRRQRRSPGYRCAHCGAFYAKEHGGFRLIPTAPSTAPRWQRYRGRSLTVEGWRQLTREEDPPGEEARSTGASQTDDRPRMESDDRSGGFFEYFFGRRIGGTRIFPIASKIVLIFVIFLLASNISSNLVNSRLTQSELKKKIREILALELEDFNNFCSTQHEVYQYTKNMELIQKNMQRKGMAKLSRSKAVLLGIRPGGRFMFHISKREQAGKRFDDTELLENINKLKATGVTQGFLPFNYLGDTYYGFFMYNPNWDIFILKGEEESQLYAGSRRIFRNSIFFVIIITLVSSVVGVFLLQYILRYIRKITAGMIKMNEEKSLKIIPLENAPNDDITFLGMSFNNLAATIDTLLGIFQKFVTKDVTDKAYKEKTVRLEGSDRELTILFTDIKKFTNMTEALGTYIIKLLNMYYDGSIHAIMDHKGIIGSIIGDALLAVFGVLDNGSGESNKSMQAVRSAYKVQDVAKFVRGVMAKRRRALEEKGGRLTPEQEKVFNAVSIETGVGIDGGSVFYGTIGSYEQMTNTVIGDNVNSASRLEGLTRIYKVPVICSAYIMEDIQGNAPGHDVTFIELDTVQVKGKTIGKKIYWPVTEDRMTPELSEHLTRFKKGLTLYYDGRWPEAAEIFHEIPLELADVFKERTATRCPENWNGIWTMTSK